MNEENYRLSGCEMSGLNRPKTAARVSSQMGANRTLETIHLTTFFGVKQTLAERLETPKNGRPDDFNLFGTVTFLLMFNIL